MFCERCGNKIPGDSQFCPSCGASIEIDTPIADRADQVPVKLSAKKPGSVGIIIGLVVLIAAGVFGSYYIISRTGKNYVYIALKKSAKSYTSEASKFVNGNPVIKRIDDLVGKSYSQTIEFQGQKVQIKNDTKKQIFALEAPFNLYFMNFALKLFITDKSIIVGSPQLAYFETGSASLGDDLAMAFDNCGLGDEGEMVKEMLKSVDLSYSNLFNGNLFDAFGLDKKTVNRYSKLLTALIKKSEYEKESTEIDLESKSVKGKTVTLTADNKVLKSWLKSDVVPTIKSDADLKKYLNNSDELSYSMRYYLSGNLPSFDELLDELDSLIEVLDDYEDYGLRLELGIYKDVIVTASLSPINSNGGFQISAIGDKHRLDSISASYRDGYEDWSVSLVGNHIGSNVFTSTINTSNYGRNSRFTVEWDTTESDNNLSISSRDFSERLRLTFAKDGDEIVFDGSHAYMPLKFLIGPLNESIELPANTSKLRNFDINSIM